MGAGMFRSPENAHPNKSTKNYRCSLAVLRIVKCGQVYDVRRTKRSEQAACRTVIHPKELVIFGDISTTFTSA
jgi:hypothetical protein